jgi:hypothetical protein
MVLNISNLSYLHPKQLIKGMLCCIGVTIISYKFLYDENADSKWIKKNKDIKRYNEKKISEMEKKGDKNNKILDIIKKNDNGIKINMTMKHRDT